MRSGQIAPILELYIANKIATCLVGPPGGGKTSIVKQIATKLGYELLITHPVVADPTDYKGIPFIADGIAKFLPFGILRQLVEATAPTVCFIDDLGQASPMTQAALMQLVLERKIDDKDVSPHVRFVAATNRKEDMAAVTSVIEPLKSRFVLLNFETNFDDWKKDFAIPVSISPEIIAFFNFRRELFHDFKPTQEMKNSPNPRTIEFLDSLFKTLKDTKVSKKIEKEAYSGAVGPGCALEFYSFLEMYRAVPDIRVILKSPDTVDVPDNKSVCFALTSAIVNIVDEDTLKNAFKFVGRMRREFAPLFSQELKTKKKHLITTSAYVEWAMDLDK